MIVDILAYPIMQHPGSGQLDIHLLFYLHYQTTNRDVSDRTSASSIRGIVINKNMIEQKQRKHFLPSDLHFDSNDVKSNNNKLSLLF